MANNPVDPLENLILDGRVRTHAYKRRADVVPLTVSLDLLCTKLRTYLHSVYCSWEPLRRLYAGPNNTILQNITNDVNHMIDFALWILYNRLRSVAERHAPHIRLAAMNPRAPCSNRMEFPNFVSSLLQSIGPLTITDASEHIVVIYIPPNGTMQTYGRAAQQAPLVNNYDRLIENLRICGVHMSPLEMTNLQGSFWTTCRLINVDGLYDVLGTVNPAHYTNEDIPKCILLDPLPALTPFQDLTLTAGLVTDEATIQALAAIAAPPNIPAGETVQSTGRPAGLIYNVNYFGIRVAVAAGAATDAQPAGCYVLGRGTTPTFTCYLAQQITEYDVSSILRYRLTR